MTIQNAPTASGGGSFDPASPPPIGDVAPDTGDFTDLSGNNGKVFIPADAGAARIVFDVGISEGTGFQCQRSGVDKWRSLSMGAADGSDDLQCYNYGRSAVDLQINDSDGEVIVNAPVRLKGYLVAALPAGNQGDFAFVTDALLPAFLATVAGGGAVVTPVFFNGSNWITI